MASSDDTSAPASEALARVLLERAATATHLGPSRASFAAVGAAGAAGRDDVLPPLYAASFAQGADPGEVYETTLQLVLFCGYPRAIAALDALDRARAAAGIDPWPPTRSATAPARPSDATDLPSTDALARTWETGLALAGRVYGKNVDRLRARMRRISPELEQWMILEGYGRVLARPGLDLAGRECSVVPALTALAAFPQLDSHLRGALALGLARPALEEAILIAEAVAPPGAGERARALLARLA